MRRKLIILLMGRNTGPVDMVLIVTVDVLSIESACGASPVLAGDVGIVRTQTIVLVIEEAVEIEPAFVLPEVVILVAEHHDGNLAAVVLVLPGLGIADGRYAEGVLQVDGGTLPVTPVVLFGESHKSHVVLHIALRTPHFHLGLPQPGEKAFARLLENLGIDAEHVGILGRKGTSRIVDDVLGIR